MNTAIQAGVMYDKAGWNKAGVTTNFVVMLLRRSLSEQTTLSNAVSQTVQSDCVNFI